MSSPTMTPLSMTLVGGGSVGLAAAAHLVVDAVAVATRFLPDLDPYREASASVSIAPQWPSTSLLVACGNAVDSPSCC